MAIKAFTLSSVKTIESEQDEARGTAEATKFTIGAIDAFVSAYISDRSFTFVDGATAENAVAQMKIAESNIDTVRFGLKGWENFKAADGADLPFKTTERVVIGKKYTVLADDCLAVMELDLIRELANAIKKINEVTKEDAGKSVKA
jgi:hypothetical protein